MPERKAPAASRLIRPLLAIVALASTLTLATQAQASTPKSGTYKATTTQCGTSAAPHPCYSFTFKLARGRCANGHHVAHGLCVTVRHETSGFMTKLDVTCPDGTTFPSQIIGPEVSSLLSPKNSFKFKSSGGATEGGKEIIFDVEAMTLSIKGSKASGTLSLLTEESIGDTAPPQCSSGSVTFTAKRI
jgi:hypothetical protein